MCIDSVKETCFSQKYQKWIYQVLEMSSSFIVDSNKTETSFSNHSKGVWSCSLCFVSLASVKTWMEGAYDMPHTHQKKIPISSFKKIEPNWLVYFGRNADNYS